MKTFGEQLSAEQRLKALHINLPIPPARLGTAYGHITYSPHRMFLPVEIVRHLSNPISRFPSTLKPNDLAIHRLEFSLLHECASEFMLFLYK
jgi:hypothetical protein